MSTTNGHSIIHVVRGRGPAGFGFHIDDGRTILFIPLLEQSRALEHLLKLIDDGNKVVTENFSLISLFHEVMVCKESLAKEIIRLAEKI